MKKQDKDNGSLDPFKDCSFMNCRQMKKQTGMTDLSVLKQIKPQNKMAQTEFYKPKKVKHLMQSQSEHRDSNQFSLEQLRSSLLELYQQHQRNNQLHQNMKNQIAQYPFIKNQNFKLQTEIAKIKQMVKKALLQRQKKNLMSKKVQRSYQ